MGGLTVLIADDESVLRQLLIRILERRGYRVLEAEDGAVAERCLAEAPDAIDVAIVDVTMPPGCVETVEALLRQRPDLGVILTSGIAPAPEVKALLERCGGAFVGKPFAPAELLRAVEEVGGGARSR